MFRARDFSAYKESRLRRFVDFARSRVTNGFRSGSSQWILQKRQRGAAQVRDGKGCVVYRYSHARVCLQRDIWSISIWRTWRVYGSHLLHTAVHFSVMDTQGVGLSDMQKSRLDPSQPNLSPAFIALIITLSKIYMSSHMDLFLLLKS